MRARTACAITNAHARGGAFARGGRRLVVLAGDISPVDVITHVPILCEEAGVPYVYVPSKEDLGLAGATKRPTSCIMVTPKADADYREAYDEVHAAVSALPVPV